MKPFHVYMLRCADGAYDTGHTDDLEKRLGEHASGACCGFARKRRAVELVRPERASDASESKGRGAMCAPRAGAHV